MDALLPIRLQFAVTAPTTAWWFAAVILAALAGIATVFLLVPRERHALVTAGGFAAVVCLFAGLVALVVFVLSGTADGIDQAANHRLTLLGHLLKGALVIVIGLAAVSILSALVLRSTLVRRSVRSVGRRLRDTRRHGDVLPPVMKLLGTTILWLSDSSLQIKDFQGSVDGVDAAAVSSALSGFLSDIGSQNAIGAAGPLDPRLETAPLAAGTITEDLENALSEAPYGKAASALIGLAQRLLPREQLTVSGHVLASVQRGLGITMTLATANGSVVSTETLWAGDFDPTVIQPEASVRAQVSAPLALALASAVWVTYALADRSSLRNLVKYLDTAHWQSYALVRVGLQGPDRPARMTRAIYARAVDVDPENRTAVFNLGLAESRAPESGGSRHLAEIGRARLEELYAKLCKLEPIQQRLGDRRLRLSVLYNLVVDAINVAHRAGDATDAYDIDRLRERTKDLTVELNLLTVELHLANVAELTHSPNGVLAALMYAGLGVWAGCQQKLGQLLGKPTGDCLDLRLDAEPVGDRHRALIQALQPLANARTQYNIACYWANSETPTRAFDPLTRSLEVGDADVNATVRDDPAFLPLGRDLELFQRFEKLVADSAI